MSSKHKSRDRDESQPRLNEKAMSAVVRGVFWFTWLTARYRQAAGMAAKIEGQRPDLN